MHPSSRDAHHAGAHGDPRHHAAEERPDLDLVIGFAMVDSPVVCFTQVKVDGHLEHHTKGVASARLDHEFAAEAAAKVRRRERARLSALLPVAGRVAEDGSPGVVVQLLPFSGDRADLPTEQERRAEEFGVRVADSALLCGEEVVPECARDVDVGRHLDLGQRRRGLVFHGDARSRPVAPGEIGAMDDREHVAGAVIGRATRRGGVRRAGPVELVDVLVGRREEPVLVEVSLSGDVEVRRPRQRNVRFPELVRPLDGQIPDLAQTSLVQSEPARVNDVDVSKLVQLVRVVFPGAVRLSGTNAGAGGEFCRFIDGHRRLLFGPWMRES